MKLSQFPARPCSHTATPTKSLMHDRPLNVLLVEDDTLYVKLLHKVIAKAHSTELRLVAVHSWQHAVETIQARDFDAILLDLNLPDSHGLQTVELATATAPNLPIVVLTGFNDEELALEAVRLGAQDYLIKHDINGTLLLRALRYAIERKQTLQALRASEEKYRSVVDSVQEVIFQLDRRGCWRFLNPAWQTVAGRSPQDSLGQRASDFIHPDDRSRHEEECDALMHGRKDGSTYQVRLQTAKGSDRLVEVELRPHRTPNGTIDGLSGMLNDITARQMAHTALERSLGLLRATFESTADGIVVVDSKGNITNWNRKLLEMCCPPDTADSSQDEAEVLECVMAQLSAPEGFLQHADCIDPPDIETFDCLHLKDGRRLERYSHPCRVGEDIVGRVWSFRDTTERQRAQEALRQSEERFRTLVANIPGAVYRAGGNLDRAMVFISDAITHIVGYAASEFMGANSRPFASLIHPDDRDRVSDEIAAAVGDRVPYILEYRLQCADGSWRWVYDKGQSIFNEDGEPIYLDGAIFDITERKQAEAALRQSETLQREKADELERTLHDLKRTQAQLVQNEKMVSLGQLVAGIAHEINNPVSFIYGNVDVAREYAIDLLHLLELYQQHCPDPDPEIAEIAEDIDLEFVKDDFARMLDSMRGGAERIRQIVLSLRNFSRLDEAERKRVNLHEGIDSTLTILQHRLNGNDRRPPIQLVKEYGDLPPVECYPSSLNQVLMHLCGNSIDAIEQLWSQLDEAERQNRQPPCIWIRTETRDRDRVTIRIRDNGPGIPAKMRDRLFDPFFTTKPAGKGTGLGLSIAHSIVVDKHQGAIACSANSEKGAEFTVELPIGSPPHREVSR